MVRISTVHLCLLESVRCQHEMPIFCLFGNLVIISENKMKQNEKVTLCNFQPLLIATLLSLAY